MTPEFKECPCGIARQDCEYHKQDETDFGDLDEIEFDEGPVTLQYPWYLS